MYSIVEYAHLINKNTAEFTASDMSRWMAWFIKQPVRRDLMNKNIKYNSAMSGRVLVDVEQVNDSEVIDAIEEYVQEEEVALQIGLSRLDVDALKFIINEVLTTYDMSEMPEYEVSLKSIQEVLETVEG